LSIDVDALQQSLLADIARFKQEALAVHDTLVLPTWMKGPLHGFNQTLYGYMMGVFSLIDLLSYYWFGTSNRSQTQTLRMVDFMEKYINPNREAHNIAVHFWRHKLMHTSRPRALSDPTTGKKLYWLLQWFEPHLSREQHYTFTETDDMRILSFGAIYLIEDIERAAQAYFADLKHSAQLQANAEAVETEITSYSFKPA
jgi:hypothetical protein